MTKSTSYVRDPAGKTTHVDTTTIHDDGCSERVRQEYVDGGGPTIIIDHERTDADGNIWGVDSTGSAVDERGNDGRD